MKPVFWLVQEGAEISAINQWQSDLVAHYNALFLSLMDCFILFTKMSYNAWSFIFWSGSSCIILIYSRICQETCCSVFVFSLASMLQSNEHVCFSIEGVGCFFTPHCSNTHIHMQSAALCQPCKSSLVSPSIAWMCLKIWIFYETLPSAFESAWGFSLLSLFFTWTQLFSPLFHHPCRQDFILKPCLLSLTRFSWCPGLQISSQRKCSDVALS